MSVVVISTVTFVLGTMPELTDNIDIMLFDNETEVRIHETIYHHQRPHQPHRQKPPSVAFGGCGASVNLH